MSTEAADLQTGLTDLVRANGEWLDLVARLDARIAEDWSGDTSLFVEAVLREAREDDEAIRRLRRFSIAVSQAARQLRPDLYPYVRFTLPDDETRVQAG